MPADPEVDRDPLLRYGPEKGPDGPAGRPGSKEGRRGAAYPIDTGEPPY